MARALLVKPTRVDAGQLVRILEDAGLEVEVADSLEPARLERGHSRPIDLLFMDSSPGVSIDPGWARMEWVLVPPQLDEETEAFCREWGGWLVDDPLRRETLLRKVIRASLELANLRQALGNDASIHAVDDLWFPILERLRRRLE